MLFQGVCALFLKLNVSVLDKSVTENSIYFKVILLYNVNELSTKRRRFVFIYEKQNKGESVKELFATRF